MDILFKTVAYDLDVSERETYDFTINEIYVECGKLQDVPNDMDKWNEKAPIYRVVFYPSGLTAGPSPSANQIMGVLVQSPDILIKEYDAVIFGRWNDCLFFK